MSTRRSILLASCERAPRPSLHQQIRHCALQHVSAKTGVSSAAMSDLREFQLLFSFIHSDTCITHSKSRNQGLELQRKAPSTSFTHPTPELKSRTVNLDPIAERQQRGRMDMAGGVSSISSAMPEATDIVRKAHKAGGGSDATLFLIPFQQTQLFGLSGFPKQSPIMIQFSSRWHR